MSDELDQMLTRAHHDEGPLTLAAIERLFDPVPYEPWKCPACGGENFHPLVNRYFDQQWRSVMKPGEPDPIGRAFCIYPKSWTG